MKQILTTLLVMAAMNIVMASELLPNIEGNKLVIKSLIENGTNLEKLHALEHHFNAKSNDALIGLMEKGKSLGYRAENIGDSIYEGKHYWYGDLVKDTRVDLDIINAENVIMLELAEEFMAEYDGWGTLIIK